MQNEVCAGEQPRAKAAQLGTGLPGAVTGASLERKPAWSDTRGWSTTPAFFRFQAGAELEEDPP